jgi:ribosome maturation factor RimP
MPTFLFLGESAQRLASHDAAKERMPQKSIDPQLESELQAIAESAGCELLHAEFQGGVLRLVLDRDDGGVTLRDCEQVSRQASALLDVAGFGGERRYTLEVSSPGLDRQLYRPRDYQRFLGRRARVTFTSPETGRKRTVIGRLERFDDAGGGMVTVIEDDTAASFDLPLERVQTARLEIEIA